VIVLGIAVVDFFTSNLTIACAGPGCLADTDDDGLPADQDACPTSDVRATMVLDGCHTGVDNVLDDEGCTLVDGLDACALPGRTFPKAACRTTSPKRNSLTSTVTTAATGGESSSCTATGTKEGAVGLLLPYMLQYDDLASKKQRAH
jgi:hypothetical protein